MEQGERKLEAVKLLIPHGGELASARAVNFGSGVYKVSFRSGESKDVLCNHFRVLQVSNGDVRSVIEYMVPLTNLISGENGGRTNYQIKDPLQCTTLRRYFPKDEKFNGAVRSIAQAWKVAA